MKLFDLESLLLAEGCNLNSFAIGERGNADDAYCIANKNGKWEIFYTERGKDSPPIFSTDSESEACKFFSNHILSQKHWHLMGWFMEIADAVELESRIRALGVRPVRNDISPTIGKGQERFRVYVMGTDVFLVLRSIPEVPIIKDTGYPRGSIEGLKIGVKYLERLRLLPNTGS